MTAPDIAALLPATGSLPAGAGADIANDAEAAGFDGVLVPETWGREAFSRLGHIAASTDRVTIGTGIVPVHSRSPALLAQAIATVDELSDGRAMLGLGLSSPTLIESWHGIEYQPALRRQRETIEIIRTVLSGDDLEYDGHIFDLEHFRLRFDPPRSTVPIFVGAQGETNAELTGGFADGWMPNRIPRSELPHLRAHVDRGARLQDRDPTDVATAPYVTTCVLEDGERARQRCREVIAFYVGGMGDFHFQAVANHGYRETAEQIKERWQDGDHDASRAAVTDELLEEIALAGSPETVETTLEQYESVADTVITLFPTTASREEIGETIEHIGSMTADD